MIAPTLEQSRILAAPLAPLRIAAGAGTGKTTTVALLVAELVSREKMDPESVLGITFTNKAAAELADRIRHLVAPLAGPGREAEVHTYHGFAAQVVGEFGALVGVERNSPVITPTFSRQLLFDIVHNRRFEHFDPTWAGSSDSIQRLGAAIGDHLVNVDEMRAAAEEIDPWPERLELLAAWDDYSAEKRRLGVVDYADLITAAVELLEGHPDVADRIRSRYQLVLLDEYQDTNPAQRILLQHLFADGFPTVAVGDVDQTIYEWRGATADNFVSFPTHFPSPDGAPTTQLRLTVNRRSDTRILDVANLVRHRIAPDPDLLIPGPEAGEGFVGVRWAADAVVEADWIADEAQRLHEQGVGWNEMAILFRKNRHIALVHDALSEREIPVEVANLGGLLSIPEVADVRAWMRVLHAPEDGPALLRVLMGPNYALGMGDLVHLTHWAHVIAPVMTGDQEPPLGRTMLEAFDHLDDMTGLPERARTALERFGDLYRYLLTTAQAATLAELTRTILDQTGAWRDIEARGPAGRLTGRLNLYRFLDLTEEWSPLEGRPSLGAFLDHLSAMEENPADELDAARLSGEEAVAMVTVHRAKGLEWDVVFIPAIVSQTFPARSVGFENPFTKAQWLPHQFRRDTPPPIDAAMSEKEANDVLRARHLAQEWRTAYVAVTRARRRLYLSGAHWYGQLLTAKSAVKPSELFDLVANYEGTEDLGFDPEPERPEILRVADQPPAPDPLFPDGWAAAVRRSLQDPGHPFVVAAEAGIEDEAMARAGEYRERLFELETIPRGPEQIRRSTSVTGLVNYASCPRRHYWSDVDRLPRRPSPAARRGVEIHRRIELHGLGHVPLAELDPDRYDVVDEATVPGTDPYTGYLSSEYAERRPLQVELPFEFDTESGVSVRGRIDAIYPDGDGWEIVDFKSGRRREEPWLGVQLQAYAVAADRVDFGLGAPSGMSVSFVYLGDGVEVVRREADPAWMEEAIETVESITAGIGDELYDPIPSIACRTCEFARFCAPGRQWLTADQG